MFNHSDHRFYYLSIGTLFIFRQYIQHLVREAHPKGIFFSYILSGERGDVYVRGIHSCITSYHLAFHCLSCTENARLHGCLIALAISIVESLVIPAFSLTVPEALTAAIEGGIGAIWPNLSDHSGSHVYLQYLCKNRCYGNDQTPSYICNQ